MNNVIFDTPKDMILLITMLVIQESRNIKKIDISGSTKFYIFEMSI